MQIAELSAPWKLAVLRRTCFSRCCNFKRLESAANSQAGRTYIIVDVMSALCRVTLRPERSCLHLNRQYAVVNNLKALESVASLWLLYVTFLSKIRQIYLSVLQTEYHVLGCYSSVSLCSVMCQEWALGPKRVVGLLDFQVCKMWVFI